MTDISKEIKTLIKKKSSVRKLSKEIGVDRRSLYLSLKGGANPTLKTLTRILNHLGYELRISKKKEEGKNK